MRNAEEVEHFLSSFYQDLDGTPKSGIKRILLVGSHPVMTLIALRYVVRHPIVVVSIPDTERSRASWLYETRRPWNLRGFISSYIEIPSPVDHYWQGASKKKLRTRSTRAETAGFSARPIASNEIRKAMAHVFRDRGWDERDVEDAQVRLPEPLEELICVGVFDSTDHIVGFCIGILTGNIVRTLWSCTSQKGNARWLCFSGYVREASARGVRFIIQSPPWAFSGGNQIFAGHLGFVPARIRTR
jgi:hypothetical protein